MQKTMAEVRKVAAAIGWSPETLARAWEAAGIAIAADPVIPWREAYTTWMLGREHDTVPEQDVWKAAVDWCAEQVWEVKKGGHYKTCERIIYHIFGGRGG